MTRTRTSIATLVLLAAAALPTTFASPAAAATASFSNGVLTFTGTSGDDVLDVSCVSNTVRAGGVDSGIDCTVPTKIILKGLAGHDDLSVEFAGMGTFSSLTSSTLLGGDGSDDLYGGDVKDTLKGGPGEDRAYLSGGKDALIGGGDADTIHGASVSDLTVTQDRVKAVGMGTDSHSQMERLNVTGTGGDDHFDFSGFRGTAQLSSGAGADDITGTAKGDLMSGEDGSDVIHAGKGNDILGADPSGGPTGNDLIDGGPGRDAVSFYGTSGSTLTDTSFNGQGADTLASIDFVTMMPKDPGPFAFNGSGFSGDTYVYGTSASGDTLVGGSGDDSIQPMGGTDTITGGPGTDATEFSSDGNVTLTNGSLTDGAFTQTLSGIDHARILGGSSAQTFQLGTFGGTVDVHVGGGNDIINGNGTGTRVVYDGGTTITVTPTALVDGGTTKTLSAVGKVRLAVDGSGPFVVDGSTFTGALEVDGTPENDTFIGGSQKDTLSGYAGEDTLDGNGGNDTLYGMQDADTLDGGQGTDRCDGKAADTQVTSCEKPAPAD